MTPEKHFRVGDVVLVRGYEQHGSRRVVELYDQKLIPGGVRLDKPVDLFRSWNEDELLRINP
jgi:hypothetical protein